MCCKASSLPRFAQSSADLKTVSRTPSEWKGERASGDGSKRPRSKTRDCECPRRTKLFFSFDGVLTIPSFFSTLLLLFYSISFSSPLVPFARRFQKMGDRVLADSTTLEQCSAGSVDVAHSPGGTRLATASLSPSSSIDGESGGVVAVYDGGSGSPLWTLSGRFSLPHGARPTKVRRGCFDCRFKDSLYLCLESEGESRFAIDCSTKKSRPRRRRKKPTKKPNTARLVPPGVRPGPRRRRRRRHREHLGRGGRAQGRRR